MKNLNASLFSEYLSVATAKPSDETVLQFYYDNKIERFSYSELYHKILYFNFALQELGIKKKDRVGIVSENRWEWLVSDFATNSTGIINVPTFPNFTSEQQKFIFNDCDAKVIICSNKLLLNNILNIRDELEHLKYIITFDDELENESENILSFNKLIANAKNNHNLVEIEENFLSQVKNVNLNDVLTIIYTSGTTGNPKGVTLTNKNIVADLNGLLNTNVIVESDEFLSFLPMCHAYERMVIYTFLLSGCKITIAQSIEQLSSNIKEVKPTVITAVPKLLETVKSKMQNAINNEKPKKSQFVKNAIDYSIGKIKSEKKTKASKFRLKIYDKLIFSKLRSGLGGKLRYIISGGAALQPEVQLFFQSIGLPILQGYGLTECSPVVSLNLPHNNELGTVGKAIDGVEIKIDNNGEILVRGDIVMQGYWHNDLATRSCIDDHNWFHTGDIGQFTDLGNLQITGRLKNIIVTSGGKNISPNTIEDLLRISDFIAHIIVYGDNQDFLVALISPELAAIKSLAEVNKIEYNSIEELISNEEILNIVKRDIDKHQVTLAKFERVRKFKILTTAFSVEGGELTPKLSLKRNVIFEKYKNEIDDLYRL